MMWLLALLGCSSSPSPVCGGATGEGATYLVRSIQFVRIRDGVVEGFDLDESDDTGVRGECGHDDQESPTGELGVDNNFSALTPVLASSAAVAAESLLDGSIARGELLITLTLDDVDSWQDDSCVSFTLGRAEGDPLLGADGRVLPDQTLAASANLPSTAVAAMAGEGAIRAEGLEYRLPFDVLNVPLDLEVSRGAFEVRRRFDGAITGVMGGVIPIRQITDMLERPDVRLGAFVPLVLPIADIEREGECDGLSFGFTFEAIPIHLEPAG